MDITIFLYPLIFLMIVGALIAVETANLLSSIISLGAVGFLLSIAFLLLGAPEIAITQIVVEIIVLVILIRATINRDLTAVSGDREFIGLVFTVAMIFTVGIIAFKTLSFLPQFGTSPVDQMSDIPSQVYLSQSLEKTRSANVLEAMLLEFRGLDALAAVAVFFGGIIGALALLRKKARKSITEPDQEVDVFELTTVPAGMSLIVKTVTRWIKGFILLFGIYLILNGHTSPGGGFAGGVIVACALILVTLAEGQAQARTLGRRTAAGLSAAGALLLLAMMTLNQTQIGRIFNDYITRMDTVHAGLFNFSTAQFSEVGIGLMMGSSLYLVFSHLAALHVRVKNGEREIVQRRRQ